MLNRRLMGTGAVAAILLASAAGWAGYKADTVTTVIVSGATGYAAGNLGYARNSPNTTEWLGCTAEAYLSGSTTYYYTSCSATDRNGAIGTCWSSDEKMFRAASSLGSDGYLNFGWNNAGACSYISVDHDSYFQPKAL